MDQEKNVNVQSENENNVRPEVYDDFSENFVDDTESKASTKKTAVTALISVAATLVVILIINIATVLIAGNTAGEMIKDIVAPTKIEGVWEGSLNTGYSTENIYLAITEDKISVWFAEIAFDCKYEKASDGYIKISAENEEMAPMVAFLFGSEYVKPEVLKKENILNLKLIMGENFELSSWKKCDEETSKKIQKAVDEYVEPDMSGMPGGAEDIPTEEFEDITIPEGEIPAEGTTPAPDGSAPEGGTTEVVPVG